MTVIRHAAEPGWITTTRCVRCAQNVAYHRLLPWWRRLLTRVTPPGAGA